MNWPTEAQFKLLFAAVETLQREKLTRLSVDIYVAKGLSDPEFFKQEKAFSIATKEAMPQIEAIQEECVLLFAKLIELRDFVRQQVVEKEISVLTK